MRPARALRREVLPEPGGGAIRGETARGRTMLMRAATTGDREAVVALLSAGAELEETDLDGKTALLLAAKAGQWKAVELLLRSGWGEPGCSEW